MPSQRYQIGLLAQESTLGFKEKILDKSGDPLRKISLRSDVVGHPVPLFGLCYPNPEGMNYLRSDFYLNFL